MLNGGTHACKVSEDSGQQSFVAGGIELCIVLVAEAVFAETAHRKGQQSGPPASLPAARPFVLVAPEKNAQAGFFHFAIKPPSPRTTSRLKLKAVEDSGTGVEPVIWKSGRTAVRPWYCPPKPCP